jgi:hypothetical protein
MAMKTYRATQAGFDGVAIREPGDLFTTSIVKGSWMDEVDADGNVVESDEPVPASGAQQADPAALTAGSGTDPLAQSIANLTTYLEGVSDIGAVEALLAAEQAGQKRSGAVAAIEARIAALKA